MKTVVIEEKSGAPNYASNKHIALLVREDLDYFYIRPDFSIATNEAADCQYPKYAWKVSETRILGQPETTLAPMRPRRMWPTTSTLRAEFLTRKWILLQLRFSSPSPVTTTNLVSMRNGQPLRPTIFATG